VEFRQDGAEVRNPGPGGGRGQRENFGDLGHFGGLFPVSRERFLADLARLDPALPTPSVNPGDVLELAEGHVVCHVAASPLAETEADDTALIRFDPTASIPPLTDPDPEACGPQSSFGGPVVQHFAYDALYRLTCAAGEFRPSGRESNAYTLRMAYDAIHNITGKVQDHVTVRGGRGEPSCTGGEPRLSLTGDPRTQRGTACAWPYAYSGSQPHAPTHIGERTFFYDQNGNQTGWASDTSGQRRRNTWDEENRLQEVVGPSGTTAFANDDAGQRILKRGEMGETVYVNQFYVVRNGAIATKHVFAGITRVASKLMPGESGGQGGGGSGGGGGPPPGEGGGNGGGQRTNSPCCAASSRP
jgi:YD repeat-containing protein